MYIFAIEKRWKVIFKSVTPGFLVVIVSILKEGLLDWDIVNLYPDGTYLSCPEGDLNPQALASTRT